LIGGREVDATVVEASDAGICPGSRSRIIELEPSQLGGAAEAIEHTWLCRHRRLQPELGV